MPIYVITEHRGQDVKAVATLTCFDARGALRKVMKPPQTIPSDICMWRCIDDGMGGCAIIDPSDEDHFFRADPRYVDDTLYISGEGQY